MKYLKKFNENLFTSKDNEEITQKIYDWLLSNDYTIIEGTNGSMLVQNLKLDENFGTYDLIVDNNTIKLEYYKNGQLQYNFDLEDILPSTRIYLKNLLKTKLKAQKDVCNN